MVFMSIGQTPTIMSDTDERPSKRRLGFRRACVYCRKKKHRCDGGKPTCLGCSSRGIQCQYYNDTEATQIETANAEVLADLECQAIDGSPSEDRLTHKRPVAAESRDNAHRTWTPRTGPHRSPTEERLRTSISSGSGRQAGSGKAPSVSQQTKSPQNRYFGDSSSFEFVSKISHLDNGPTEQTAITEALSTLEEDDEPLKHWEKDDFPSQEIANQLVDAYFERVHTFYPFVHEGSFRHQYEQLWLADESSFEPNDIAWLATMNLVLAYGYEFYAQPEEDSGALAAPFVGRAKSIILSHIFKATDLRLVQALLLLCHYLQGTLQLDECWNLVGLMTRSALSIGLHRNSAEGGSFSVVQEQERKRVWWGCIVLDRTLSMKFGRPPSIPFDDARDVDLPLDVDDQYIGASLVPRQPGRRPSRLSFFIQTIKLSEIIDNILNKMYDSGNKLQRELKQSFCWSQTPKDSAKLGYVVIIDGQLQAWWSSLPSYLREESELPDGIDIQRQRLVMRIRYLQMRLLLHRPCFLLFRKSKMDDDFLKHVALSSSKLCTSIARETIQLIHLNYSRYLLNSLWYNLHYVFTSLAVLLAVQTMEPTARDLVSSSEDRAFIGWGMNFLRSASSSSILASRYVAMLSKPKPVPDADDPVDTGHREAGFVVDGEVEDISIAQANRTQLLEQGASGNQMINLGDDFDFEHLESMIASYDFSGMGLPPTVWPAYDGTIL